MRMLYLACFLVLCVGCSSGSEARSSARISGACGSDLVWHETVYYRETVVALPARGESLGPAGIPSCPDVLGGETGASRAVEATSLAGIDPRVAIAASDDPRHGYFGAGYFVQLPSHPLHVVAVEAHRLAGCTRARRVRLVGTVKRNIESLTLRIRRGRYLGRSVIVLVDARTRIEHLSRRGLPYVGLGWKVAVEAVTCRASGAPGEQLVARRITAAG